MKYFTPYSSDWSIHVEPTLGRLDIEKSSILDDEQANICLMADTVDKNEVNLCFESNTSSSASSDDEKDMPYDVLLQNYHMISI